jgi:hypothetical protein
VIVLAYLCPIVLLLFSQRGVLQARLVNRSFFTYQEAELDELMTTLSKFKDKFSPLDIMASMRAIVRYYYGDDTEHVKLDTEHRSATLLIKYSTKALLLVLILPVAVSIFALALFWFMLDKRVLVEWTQGFIASGSVTVLSYSIDELTILRVKAALLLGALSSTLTLGEFISSEESFSDFLDRVFRDELMIDKHLLILFTLFERKVTTDLSLAGSHKSSGRTI